ncbi:hypothetical protein BgiMline_006353, partial [Biomphalaria glabrata]
MKVQFEFDHFMYAYAAKSVLELTEIQIRHQASFIIFYENYTFDNPLHEMQCWLK